MRAGLARLALASILSILPGCGDDGGSGGGATCPAPPGGDARMFVDRAAELGVTFVHHPQTPLCHITDTVGGPGTCVFDADGDGDMDAFFVDRGPHPSALYRNDGGSFVDVAAQAGVADPGDAIGCLAFDYDGDGDQDLFVTTTGPDRLYRNDGGTFADVTAAAGIVEAGYSTSAAAGDIDRDGDLDLFVGRLVVLSTCPDECYLFPIACQAETNLLFVNEGGAFVEASAARGLTDADPTLAALFFDEDDDGDLDLYVGNDMGVAFPDRLYVNDGAGNFVDQASSRGYSAAGTDTMGVDVGDYNADGTTDMVTTDFKDRPTRLYDCFDEALPCSFESMPPESTQGVHWGVGFVDVDHDGDLDLFQSGGDVFDPDLAGTPNQLFLNRGDGRFDHFAPPPESGLARLAVHRGVAFGDLDEDGDVDAVVAANGGTPAMLYNVGAAGHAIRVALGSRDAGARVTVRYEGRTLTEQALIGGSYLGSSDPRLHFGIGGACEADVEIRYLDGTAKRAKVRAGDTYRP
jgi:hypothetical protein